MASLVLHGTCKCSNLLLPLIDNKLSLHMTLAETLRQRCLLSVLLCNVGRDFRTYEMHAVIV